MKIALIGYGKMGQMVEKAALGRGHSIVGRMTSEHWDKDALREADVCIEFTRPESVLNNVKMMAKMNKNMIIGTTGWNGQMAQIRSIIEESGVGALHAPNFSIGVQLLIEILSQASRVMKAFKEYDVAGIEYHHNQKKDSPSGTALEIARNVEKNMERTAKIPFTSIRCGSIPGTHTVLFDSPCDSISITHEARNREGFASGAVLAAEWMQGRKGFYSFADCMQEIIQGRLL